MKLHSNAKTCPNSRLLLCRRVLDESWTVRQAADAVGISERRAYVYLARYRAEGEAGLLDRPAVPQSIPHRTPEDRIGAIAALRRLRMSGPEIAEILSMPLSTVSAILTRIGLGKLSRLEPAEPPNRYERRRPGELLHIDVKKLARIDGAGHRVTGNRRGQAAVSVGNTSTSVSTMRVGLPTSKYSPMRRRKQRSASCAGPSPTSPPSVFGSSG